MELDEIFSKLDPYSSSIQAIVAAGLPLSSVLIWWVRRTYYKPRRSHIYIRPVRSKRDKEFLDFISLYTSRFQANERIATEEIQCWLDGKAKLQNLDYDLWVAYCKEDPVGFLIAIHCSINNWVYIPFIGITPSEGTNAESISRLIYWAFFNKITSAYSKFSLLLMEFTRYNETGLAPEEARRRKARIKLFSSVFHLLSMDFGKLEVDYHQPTYCTDEEDCQKMAMDLYIASRTKLTKSFPKATVIEMVSDLYKRIYLHCIPCKTDRYKQIEADTKALLSTAKKTWPKTIEIARIT